MKSALIFQGDSIVISPNFDNWLREAERHQQYMSAFADHVESGQVYTAVQFQSSYTLYGKHMLFVNARDGKGNTFWIPGHMVITLEEATELGVIMNRIDNLYTSLSKFGVEQRLHQQEQVHWPDDDDDDEFYDDDDEDEYDD